MFKKKASFISFIGILILSFFIIVLILLGGIFVYYKFNKSMSNCYTNLQPSLPYFKGNNLIFEGENYLKINYKNNKKIFLNSVLNTGSMRPAISDDSLLLTIKPEQNNLNIGDIIIFNSILINYSIGHRIINIKQEGNQTLYITKGDNNDIEDEEKVKFENIKYKVIGVLY